MRLVHAMGYIAGNKLHRIVNRHPGTDTTTRAVDIHVDVRFRVITIQKACCYKCVGDLVVYLRSKKMIRSLRRRL